MPALKWLVQTHQVPGCALWTKEKSMAVRMGRVPWMLLIYFGDIRRLSNVSVYTEKVRYVSG